MERIEFKTFTKMSKNSIIDYQDLINYARKLGQRYIAITDYNSIQIFPMVSKYLEENNITDFKVIYGTGVTMLVNGLLIPVTILVRNQNGLKNLYKIITKIKTTNVKKFNKEVITRKELENLKDGLLYGIDVISMYDIYDNLTDEQIASDLIRYDFIEVRSLKDYQDYIKQIINIADDIKKIVIATGDVHYLRKEDKKDYQILFSLEGDEYLRTTKEMKEEFKFLKDNELIDKIVIKNPNKLANLIQDIEVISKERYLPRIVNSKDILLNMVYQKAYELYGKPLPELIQKRLAEELYGKNGIVTLHYESIFLIYQKLVEYSNSLGYPVCVRGIISSSFVAYLMGITGVNPLVSHYYCPDCQKIILMEDDCCVDLPKKKCPKCQKIMQKDGFNIKYIPLGNKLGNISIDINFAIEIEKDLEKYLKDTFGSNKVYKLGVAVLNNEEDASNIVDKIWQKDNRKLTLDDKKRLASNILGSKKFTEIHPSGFLIVPDYTSVYNITPITYSRYNKEDKLIYLDYHYLKNVLIINLLYHNSVSILKKLENATNQKSEDIALDDKETMVLIRSGNTDGILEIDTDMAREIIKKVKPEKFNDLIKIIGITHSVKTWDNDIAFKDMISCREDISNYLAKVGIEETKSLEVMELVSKGKVTNNCKWNLLKEDLLNNGVKEWFIKNCEKIIYLLPKAHIVSYALLVFKIAWYKTHYLDKFKEIVFNNCK